MVMNTGNRGILIDELLHEISETGFELSESQLKNLRAIFKNNFPPRKGFSSVLKVCQYVKAELLPEGTDVNGLVVQMLSDMAEIEITGWNNHPESRCYIGHYIKLPEEHKVPEFINFRIRTNGEVWVQKEFGHDDVLWNWEPK